MGRPEAPLLLERALREVQLESGLSQTQFVSAAHLPLRDTLGLIEILKDKIGNERILEKWRDSPSVTWPSERRSMNAAASSFSRWRCTGDVLTQQADGLR
jgi:hypothetical protein